MNFKSFEVCAVLSCAVVKGDCSHKKFDFFFYCLQIPPKVQGIRSISIRGCQIGMQGHQLCAKPRHFGKQDVATSRMAFLDLNHHVLQLATSNTNN